MNLNISNIIKTHGRFQNLDINSRHEIYQNMSPELKQVLNILASIKNLEDIVVSKNETFKNSMFFKICTHKIAYYTSILHNIMPIKSNTMTNDILFSKRDLLKEQIKSIETSGFYTESDMDRLVGPIRAELEMTENLITAIEATKNIE